ncbi:MAG: hypothetical protein GTN36_01095 [Candidatus Aenigmarchaeota archaeon]|nr:hypothetical protein [Candidatus Aenigmarchaeota archaeon]
MKELAYEDIITEAKKHAQLLKSRLPNLPSYEELSPFDSIIVKDYAVLNAMVQEHVSKKDTEPGHGHEHLRWVAPRGGYFADLECNARNIEGEVKQRLIKRTIAVGLLHDVERYRGFKKEHAIEGSKVAKEILARCSIEDEYIPQIIMRHDEIDLFSIGDVEFDVPFQSNFDADHILWGLEREESFWRAKEKHNIPPEEAIHDYQYLSSLRNSFKTQHGKKIGPKFVDFGIAISKHIERTF